MTHFFCFAMRSKPHTHLPPSPSVPMRSTWCGHWKDGIKKSPAKCHVNTGNSERLGGDLTNGVGTTGGIPGPQIKARQLKKLICLAGTGTPPLQLSKHATPVALSPR